MRRQLLPAERLQPGDRIIDDAGGTDEVVRITGSPGRKSPTAARLLRVFTAGQESFRTVRADEPVAIQPRITNAVAALRSGDLVRLADDTAFRVVVRVTGSPGRRSDHVAPLLRLFLEGRRDYVTIRSDARVVTRPDDLPPVAS